MWPSRSATGLPFFIVRPVESPVAERLGHMKVNGERRWVTSRRPRVKTCDGKYLVNTDELRLRFRETFLSGLKRLHANGDLKLEAEWAHLRDPLAFAAWLAPLEEITWVTYIEPPPTEQSSPDHVLKYLARYLTGGPISDRRLISHENGEVTFRARTGKAQWRGLNASRTR